MIRTKGAVFLQNKATKWFKLKIKTILIITVQMMVVFFQNKINNNNNKDSGQCKQVELIILHTIRNMIQESVSKSFLI